MKSISFVAALLFIAFSSAAQTRGSNGVILVETKRGN
jgi:hypothetical protein